MLWLVVFSVMWEVQLHGLYKSDLVPCKGQLMHVCLAHFCPCNLRLSLLLPFENASLNRHLANLSSKVDS